MGSYPSADLVYGIDLGLSEEEDWPWYTEELYDEYGDDVSIVEHLIREIPHVRCSSYGNYNSGYTGLYLYTEFLHATAYDVRELSESDLRVEDQENRDVLLRDAWSLLYPDRFAFKPGWFIALSYG